jgi:hypothetical protein
MRRAGLSLTTARGSTGPAICAALAALGACKAKVKEQPAAAAAPPPIAVATAPAAPPRRAPTREAPAAASEIPAPSTPGAVAIAAARDAGPATLNGDPGGLKREDLNRAIDAVMPGFAGCFQGGPAPGGPVGLAFDADPSGRAQNVRVSGAGAEAQKCITGALAGLRLPAFAGPSVPVEIPLAVHRPAPPPAPAPPPPAPPAPALGMPSTLPAGGGAAPGGSPPATGLPTTAPTAPKPSGSGQQPGIFVRP